MWSFRKYAGGWRSHDAGLKLIPITEFVDPSRFLDERRSAWAKAYGKDDARRYFSGAVLQTLDDQWEWMLKHWGKMPEAFQAKFNEVFARVVTGHPEPVELPSAALVGAEA
jgi:hypothetical protein